MIAVQTSQECPWVVHQEHAGGVGCREISLPEGTHFLDFVPRESEDSYTGDHGEN